MEKKQFDFANLSDTDIQQVNLLEKTLSEEKEEKIILIAYQNNND